MSGLANMTVANANAPGGFNLSPIFQCLIADGATTQSIAVGASTAASAAFQAGTSVIRLCSTTDCFVAFGAAPTATASSIFLPAGQSECFGVIGGHKVAVIQSTAGGTLSILEGA